MKKSLFLLMALILFIGTNAFAAGDLIVNGQLGIGTTPAGKLDVASTNMTAIGASPTKADENFLVGQDMIAIDSYSGTIQSGGARALSVRVDHTGTPTNTHLGIEGANYQIRLLGSGAVNQAFAQQNVLVFRSDTNYTVNNLWGNLVQLSAAGPFSGTHTVTNYVGYYSYGAVISQTLNGTDWRHAHFVDFPDYGGTVANVAGLWIDKQTYGTNNYGIVLNGYGTTGDFGSAIVFGDPATSQSVRLYAKNDGKLYVNDGSFETQHSPHDPVTGEWIFYSKNIKTGKTVRVNMEKLVKAVEKLTGETFMVETLMEN
jgi:hypothetical protein